MNHQITLTPLRAAGKTFVQAFMAVFGPLALLTLNGYIATVQEGGQVVLDLSVWTNAIIGGTAGLLAALVSLVWNWSKTPTT